MPPVQALSDLPGEAWNALAALAVAVIGGLVAVAVERIRRGPADDRLSLQVEQVRKNLSADRNGFAAEVTTKLDETIATLGDLSEQIARMDSRLWNHLEDHGRRHR